jgi:hypothetical protein
MTNQCSPISGELLANKCLFLESEMFTACSYLPGWIVAMQTTRLVGFRVFVAT